MIKHNDLIPILRKLSDDLKFAADRVQYFSGFAEEWRWESLKISKRVVDSLIRDAEKK